MATTDAPQAPTEESRTVYLTPEQVCELVPGMTKASLAQRRYRGLPPTWLAPSPRRPIYRESDVLAWVEGSERTITGSGD